MDFGTLLQTAKQNETSKKEVRTYTTKYAPPKKVEKKDKILSANIQKFLARKEMEEKQKSKEANRKLTELLALRSKDKKATRRVNVMLKRTKSANQSVIEDAVDKDNTAVTLVGPAQPDEDDYGYVSQEAAAFYNKMMEKYNKMPDEEKFPNAKKKASANLNTTKDRVRAALEKEQLEASLPHRRKRKHKEDEEESGEVSAVPEEKREPQPKPKPKNKGPPPINFTDLLKLASQKQHEPIMIEVKPKDEGPLFTKKQKLELEKEQQRRGGNENGKLNTEQVNEIRKLPPSYLSKIKKRKEISRAEINEPIYESDESVNNSKQINKAQNDASKKMDKVLKGPRDNQSIDRIPKKTNVPSTDSRIPKGNMERTPYNGHHLARQNSEGGRLPKPVESQQIKTTNEKTPNSTKVSKPSDKVNEVRNSNKHSGDSRVPGISKNGMSSDNRLKPNNSQTINKSKTPMTSGKHPNVPLKNNITHGKPLDKKRLNSDLQVKQYPPNDLRPRQFPPPDRMQKRDAPRPKPQFGNKRRIIDDDDEEYDSEMDDFIDDGPEENNDYSTYIREIFGYDKRKYRVINEEDDIDNMESSFAQQMREDVRSTKLAIMEDLEDMKKEKEEKRLKALKKKRQL